MATIAAATALSFDAPGEGRSLASRLAELLGKHPGGRIRCPKCAWEPDRHSLWSCGPPCFEEWNTFETAGRCPRCGRQWHDTQCLDCYAWSRHADWYQP